MKESSLQASRSTSRRKAFTSVATMYKVCWKRHTCVLANHSAAVLVCSCGRVMTAAAVTALTPEVQRRIGRSRKVQNHSTRITRYCCLLAAKWLFTPDILPKCVHTLHVCFTNPNTFALCDVHLSLLQFVANMSIHSQQNI